MAMTNNEQMYDVKLKYIYNKPSLGQALGLLLLA